MISTTTIDRSALSDRQGTHLARKYVCSFYPIHAGLVGDARCNPLKTKEVLASRENFPFFPSLFSPSPSLFLSGFSPSSLLLIGYEGSGSYLAAELGLEVEGLQGYVSAEPRCSGAGGSFAADLSEDQAAGICCLDRH